MNVHRAGVAESADATDSKSVTSPENKALTSKAQRQGQRADANAEGASAAELAERLAKLDTATFEALAPRIARLNRADALALLRLLDV